MAKLLSNREMELFRMALNLAVRLDNVCPDVGMGKTKQMIAEELVQNLSFDIEPDDIAESCENAGIN